MPAPTKRKTIKKTTKTTKSVYTKPAMAAIGALALAGLTGLSIKTVLDKQKNNEMIIPKSANIQLDDCDQKLQTLSALLRKEIEVMEGQLKKEKEANKKLVDQINKCNKEFKKQRAILSRNPSFQKEVTLRQTINKFLSKK